MSRWVSCSESMIGGGQGVQWSGACDALVGPVGVVVLFELAQGVEQMVLVPDQGAVQQLVPAGLYPAFHERVHARYPDAGQYEFDPRVLEDGVEQGGERAVAVPDEEPCPAAGVLEVHDEVLRGLCDPGGGRVCGGAQDPDAPAAVLEHREHVEPRPGQSDGLEEVAGQQGIGLGAQEAGPGRYGAFGCRGDPGILQELPRGGGGHLQAQDEQFTVDAPISSPGILPSPGPG